MSENKDYQRLFTLSHRISTMRGITSLLGWDQETYMPPGATANRADQLELMEGMVHKEITSKAFASALSKLIDLPSGKILQKGLSLSQKSALQRWRHDYTHATALPNKFVKAFAKLTTQAVDAWKASRKDNAYQRFAPYLEKIVIMNREKAEFLGYKHHPYDALLDEYESEMTTKEIGKIFENLRKSLTSLLKKITNVKQIDNSFLIGRFSEKKQMDLSYRLLDAMGYDLNCGRLDLSTHPFTSSGHPTDTRITTRLQNKNFLSNILVTLHEAGHALYAMDLPREQFGSPLGEAISMGIHESQSRWWETRIGQSKPFWKYFLPILKKSFGGQLEKVTLNRFYRAVNRVEPGMVRVDADEVTYNLHVIIRFELECALVQGTLNVRDLPDAWNEKMQDYLGITPKNNVEGCLQDIHWSIGAFGYFPTYTLGNLYAAQLFEAFEKGHPDWEKQVAKGQLGFIKDWLNTNVHQYGRQYQSKALLKKVTGKKFSEKPYLKYLNAKYQDIYR